MAGEKLGRTPHAGGTFAITLAPLEAVGLVPNILRMSVSGLWPGPNLLGVLVGLGVRRGGSLLAHPTLAYLITDSSSAGPG